MVTVLRAEGLRIVIFLDDHEPAHVHVFGDGEAKIDLAEMRDRPALLWAKGMSRGELRRALRVVVENRSFLLSKWSEIHG